jgi:glycerophosphoryl diester phosphodiesterase
MIIKEQFILGKNKDQNLCEDRIFVGERFVSIIDGATSKDKKDFNGHSGGWQAARLVEEALFNIENENLFNNEGSEYDICEYIRASFIPFYKEYDIDFKNEPTKRIIASCVIYDSLYKKLIMVGDCQAILIKKNNEQEIILNEKEMDEVTSNARSLYLEILIKSGKETVESLMINDLGRKYIEVLLKEQLRFQNQEIQYGYECFDGTAIPQSMIKITDVSNIEELVLSSDGYPELFDNLAQSENYLKELLIEDPLLYFKYRTTKGLMKGLNSFDDRSYISFKI